MHTVGLQILLRFWNCYMFTCRGDIHWQFQIQRSRSANTSNMDVPYKGCTIALHRL